MKKEGPHLGRAGVVERVEKVGDENLVYVKLDETATQPAVVGAFVEAELQYL